MLFVHTQKALLDDPRHGHIKRRMSEMRFVGQSEYRLQCLRLLCQMRHLRRGVQEAPQVPPCNPELSRYTWSERVFQRFHFWIVAQGVDRLPSNIHQFLVFSVALFGIMSNVERGMIVYSNEICC
jgi:hypothetical protein